jgi:hypothetical protein
MHLAFWDRLLLSKFEEWERTGEVQIPPMRDMVEGINQAMLPWWRTIAPDQVRHAVVAAAEAVDRKASRGTAEGCRLGRAHGNEE